MDDTYQKLMAENLSLRQENQRLRTILEKHGIQANIPEQTDSDASRQQQRLALYRLYFRGREDVYANRWYNKDKKKQYSPAEKRMFKQWNEEKRRYERIDSHGESRYEPLTDAVLIRHLRTKEENGGKEYAIGLYLIVDDDMCYLSAIDFDGQSWEKDVQQAIEAIDKQGFPYLIERSQSGLGAHLWFFFENAIKAKKARQFCSSLITLAMENSITMTMNTYDRIFPSQDNVTKNGLGSLIALPLEGDARRLGNSCFLNKDLSVVQNPWKGLKQTAKIQEETIDAFLNSLGPKFNMGEIGLSQTISLPIVQETVKDTSNVVTLYLEQGVSCRTQEIPSSLVNKLRRIASFHNPEFYKAERLRLSTWNKPRIISCAELAEDGFIRLPRGCQAAVVQAFHEVGLMTNVEDRRTTGLSNTFTFKGVLRESQQRAVDAMKQYECGILSAPPGYGKTVIASALIAMRGTSTLVLVHTKPLLLQWKARLSSFLEMEPGLLGGGTHTLSGILDVALIQSLAQESNMQCIAEYGLVLVDECHHVAALTYERVMKAVKAKYVYGLTATPIRNDCHHDIVFMQCGPILHQVDQSLWSKQANLSGMVISRFSAFRCDFHMLEIQQIYEKLTQDKARNCLIASDIKEQHQKKCSILVLSNRLEQLSLLHELLAEDGIQGIIMTGSQSAKTKRHIQAYLDTAKDEGKPVLILSTGKYIGEGFDFPQLDTLILASPIAWKGNVIQYAGRVSRVHEGKTEIQIFDYVDFRIPVFVRMFGKRINAYRKLGLPISQYGGQPREQLIYTPSTYWDVLKKDLGQEKGEIVFSIPYFVDHALRARLPFLTSLAGLNPKVTMILRARKTSRTTQMLQRIGITVQTTEEEIANFITIGDRIVWYGSIHLFGKIQSDDTLLRLEDPTYVADFRNIRENDEDLPLFES